MRNVAAPTMRAGVRHLSWSAVLIAMVGVTAVTTAPTATSAQAQAPGPMVAPPMVRVESVTLLEFWNLIASENRSVVLGVQNGGGDGHGTFQQVAAAHAEYTRRQQQQQQQRGTTDAAHAVEFRVTSQLPPFLSGPGVVMFTAPPPDHSCLVKPDVRSYPKQLEQCVVVPRPPFPSSQPVRRPSWSSSSSSIIVGACVRVRVCVFAGTPGPSRVTPSPQPPCSTL